MIEHLITSTAILFLVLLCCIVIWFYPTKHPVYTSDDIMHYPMGWEYLHDVGVPEEQREECYRWAFGDDWFIIKISSLCDVWRERHGNLEVFHVYDPPEKVFRKIGEYYLGR